MTPSAAALQLLLLLLLAFSVKESSPYPRGAPRGACTDMMPVHGASPSTSESPYSVYISSDRYEAGGNISVTVNGTEPFKGFLIMASTADFKGAVGYFASSAEAKDACSTGDGQWRGITHTGNEPKSILTATWTAPRSVQGILYFYATVVKDKVTFWVQLKSAPIWDGQSSTTAASISAVPTSSRPATSSAASSPVSSVSTSGCGVVKSCLSSPDGCTGDDCTYLLTWQLLPSSAAANVSVQFFMQAKSYGSASYVSVGFAKEIKMKAISIVNCIATSSKTLVTQTYATEPEEPKLISSESNLMNVTSVSGQGLVQCSFVWNNDKTARQSSQQFDLTIPYYVIMARGSGSEQGSLLQHQERPIALKNQTVVASSLYTDNLATASSKTWLMKVHGVLMSVAWMLCCTTAVILARFYKKKWLDTKLCGEKVWFAWHRGLAVASTGLTIVAFVLIYIAVGGWSSAKSSPREAHAYLGVIVTGLAVANPVMGFFRCNPGTKNRVIFNWAHWIVGNAALVLAGATLLIGLQMSVSVSPAWLVYVAAAYVACFGVTYFALVLEEFIATRSSNDVPPAADRSDMTAMKALRKTKPESPEVESRNKQDYFKDVLFVIHLVVTAAATVTLVITILAL